MQQRVEIIKALYRNADILILDEPTAVLTPQEVDELFDIMRALAAQGKSIIFITHKLKEVLAVADRMTVLRRGGWSARRARRRPNEHKLAAMMVGREVVLEVDKRPPSPADVVLEVENLEVLDERPGPWRWTTSRWRCAPARCWASPACRATARPSWWRR